MTFKSCCVYLELWEKNKRAIVYLDPKLHQVLKIKSAQIERTMPDLINEAVRISLFEDY